MNQNIAPRSFFQHKRVWVVFVVTIILALYVSKQIINADKLEFIKSFSSTNAQLFMDSFKLPIGIIAAGLSVLLLLATQHRSEQTAEQIKLTNQANRNLLIQNTQKNYYDSIADFEKYIDSNFHSDVIKIKNKRQLYKLFFPNNSHEKVEPYITAGIYKQEVKFFTTKFDRNVAYVLSSEEYETPKQKFEVLINHFILNIEDRYSVHLNVNVLKEGAQAKNELAKITKAVRELLTFCLKYTQSNEIVTIEGSYIFSLQSWADFRTYINENHNKNIEDFTVIEGGPNGFNGEIQLLNGEDRTKIEENIELEKNTAMKLVFE
jgi:hypothetical protein